MIAPYGVGKILSNICSKFSGVTADQCHNFTSTTLVMHCLWKHQVLMSQHPVSVDVFLNFENLNNKYTCTSRMQMHYYLMQCILNYGLASASYLKGILILCAIICC